NGKTSPHRRRTISRPGSRGVKIFGTEGRRVFDRMERRLSRSRKKRGESGASGAVLQNGKFSRRTGNVFRALRRDGADAGTRGLRNRFFSGSRRIFERGPGKIFARKESRG